MTDQVSGEVTRLQELIYELQIDEVMQRDVIAVTPETTMHEFKELLRVNRISGAPVMDGDRLVGIISLEDLIQALEQGAMDQRARDRMTPQVQTVCSDQPAIQAVNQLAQFGFGRLPVVDRSGRLVGVVTRGDILRGLLRRLEVSYQEEEIHRSRASHIFEDIVSDRTSLVLRYQVQALDFSGGGSASSKIKRALERLGGQPPLCRRIAVAAYEAEMNLIIHATRGGEMVVEIQPDQVCLIVTDAGPGIGDVEAAMRPGFSTAPEWIREMGFGAGMGLTNIRRCADRMELDSELARGTRLEAWFHVPSPRAAAGEEEDLL
jgi:CBS domain-containing protein/anti-sigma regulatory factor (Ser/Thr protein kinase)